MKTLDQVFQRNQNFVYRKIDDETILVPIKDNVGDMGSIYNLNEAAAFVWEHLDGARTLSDIKNMMTLEFEVSQRKIIDAVKKKKTICKAKTQARKIRPEVCCFGLLQKHFRQLESRSGGVWLPGLTV
jgi:hypothetical protein